MGRLAIPGVQGAAPRAAEGARLGFGWLGADLAAWGPPYG